MIGTAVIVVLFLSLIFILAAFAVMFFMVIHKTRLPGEHEGSSSESQAEKSQ
jgi:hypothetical protein